MDFPPIGGLGLFFLEDACDPPQDEPSEEICAVCLHYEEEPLDSGWGRCASAALELVQADFRGVGYVRVHETGSCPNFEGR